MMTITQVPDQTTRGIRRCQDRFPGRSSTISLGRNVSTSLKSSISRSMRNGLNRHRTCSCKSATVYPSGMRWAD